MHALFLTAHIEPGRAVVSSRGAESYSPCSLAWRPPARSPLVWLLLALVSIFADKP